MANFSLTDGDLSDPVTLETGVTAVIQGIESRLKIIRGEWFANRSLGLPYFPNDIVSESDAILGSKLTPARRARFRRLVVEMIRSTPGVDSVVDVELTFENRQLSIEYVAIAGDEVVTGAV